MLQQMQQTIRALQEENASLRTRLTTAPPPPPMPAAEAAQQQQSSAGSPSAGLSEQSPAEPPPKPPRKVGISALRDAEDTETGSLRKEVAALRSENEALKVSHERVLKENRVLQAKLERLEQVFASGEQRIGR